MRKVIAIRNNSKVGVIRANLLFPAGRVVTIMMDTDTSRYKEIKACDVLRVVGVEDYVEPELTLFGSVPKIDVEKSAVVEPVVAAKVEEPPVVEDLFVEEPPVVKAPSVVEEPPVVEQSPPAPVVDTTPFVVPAEAPVEDVAELEVLETAPVPDAQFSCPYCDSFVAAKKTGALNHVRSKHPAQYDEYKARLSNA